jgi:ferritin
LPPRDEEARKVASETIETALNDQVNLELFSAYLYLSMSAHFEATGLPGFAHCMRRQAQEEAGHAMRFFDFLTDRGARVALKSIDAPPADFASPLAAFEHALEHEQRVTASIHTLMETADHEGDHAARPLLLSFVSEQIQEEKTVRQIVDRLRMVGEATAGILVLDHQLAKREP